MPRSYVPRRLPVVAVRATADDDATRPDRRYVRVMDRGLAPPASPASPASGRAPRPPAPGPGALYLPSLRDWLAMSDSTSDQPVPPSPAHTVEDLRRWITRLDQRRGLPTEFALPGVLCALLRDLLDYREADERAGRFYRRPDGIEEVEWMRPYRELVDSLPLPDDQRTALNAAFDELYSWTVREVALTIGSEERLREQLLRAMPQGFSTRERVAAAAERLHGVHYQVGLPPAVVQALVSVETELRSIAGPPAPACSCPHEPSLLCAIPQHRADAAELFADAPYGDPVWLANRVRNDPEFATQLHRSIESPGG